MSKYHKIQSVYFRDPETKFSTLLEGKWSEPEFELLQDVDWALTEKIDGTNIRVYWDGEAVKFAGRTDKAQIPPRLQEALEDIFPSINLEVAFPDCGDGKEVVLYGEGYGRKIQAAGSAYLPDSNGFILFDVKVGHIWFTREAVEEVAERLKIPVVPIVATMTLHGAVEFVRKGFKSQLADIQAEGVIARPRVELKNRMGNRIITKIKTKDFVK